MEDNIIEEELDDTDSEDELDMLRNPFVGGGPKSESDWVESNDSCNEDDELNIDNNVQITEDETQFYSFCQIIHSIILMKFNAHVCLVLLYLILLVELCHSVIKVIVNIIVQQCWLCLNHGVPVMI